jgi:hypothetical protein
MLRAEFLFRRHDLYTREAVAKILAPDYPFKKQRGTWGALGIVKFWGDSNFVFGPSPEVREKLRITSSSSPD